MKNLFKNLQFQHLFVILAMSMSLFIISCGDDDLSESSFSYSFHNGQAVPTAPYGGIHTGDLSATMDLKELDNGGTMITVTLDNTIDGETYHMHAHDAADASSTPNGTPYSESPNSAVFAQMVVGNGGSVSVSQETTTSLSDLTNSYEGFFVVHDPLQAINTADITSYVIVGSFARTQTNDTYNSTTFNYDFNTGQVAAAFAYSGSHATNLGANITVTELADDRSRVTITLNNTMDGETYHTHAHDMADASTTPNGTPYLETPNGGVFANPILGNGGSAGMASISDMSYSEITSSYDGFFVVHDPLQAITTTDPTTYVILGVFAR